MLETVDLPVAMLPVRPRRSMFGGDSCKLLCGRIGRQAVQLTTPDLELRVRPHYWSCGRTILSFGVVGRRRSSGTGAKAAPTRFASLPRPVCNGVTFPITDSIGSTVGQTSAVSLRNMLVISLRNENTPYLHKKGGYKPFSSLWIWITGRNQMVKA